jgi:hypothetical protein
VPGVRCAREGGRVGEVGWRWLRRGLSLRSAIGAESGPTPVYASTAGSRRKRSFIVGGHSTVNIRDVCGRYVSSLAASGGRHPDESAGHASSELSRHPDQRHGSKRYKYLIRLAER